MADYDFLSKQLKALLADEKHFLANSSQFAAFIFQEVEDLNWAGFYWLEEDELVLGSFQGKVACVRIPLGKGVCGTAAAEKQTILVDDVHAFSGHIACDSASESEIVVPVYAGERLVGVFDIDSPRKSRFTQDDKMGIENLVKIYQSMTNIPD
ncbi:MAG: GAF domain-containing protein [Pseudomonadota bacterium]